MRVVCLVLIAAACGGSSNHGTPDAPNPDATADASPDAVVDAAGSDTFTLDPTFGSNGLATANFGGALDGLMSIVRQSDGKYIAVGGTQEAVLVVRFATDGTFDTTFGTQGALQIPLGTPSTSIALGHYGVALQSDGKIVLAAHVYNRFGGYSGGVVARVTTDGQLDTTFGTTGIVAAPGSSGWFTSVAIQSDGKIVAGGNVLARYNADGSLDTTFATSGSISATPPIFKLALETDGSIIAITQLSLERFTATGTLDTTFATSGRAAMQSFGSTDSLRDLAIQTDGKIVVAGTLTQTSGGVTNFTVARYTTTGTPDATFGASGYVRDNSTTPTHCYGIGIQSDGKIVATGVSQFGGTSFGTLVRFTTTGGLDTTLGTTGQINSCETQSNIIFDTDGSIVSSAATGDTISKWELCKVSATGTATYTKMGTIGGSFDTATALAFQSDGKLVVGGRSYPNGPALARLDTDGTLDTTFGTNGTVQPTNGVLFQINGVVAQPAGGIVVSGVATTMETDNLVALRYTSAGTLDTTFGNNGIASASAGLDGQTYAMAGSPDGTFVAAGTTNIDREFAVARFTVNGAPDTTFGTGGVATTSFGSGTNMAQLVVVAPDHSVILCGTTSHPTPFSLAKFTAAGALDPTFGTNGIASLSASVLAEPQALALQSDGAILTLFGQINGSFQVVRTLPNGTVDTTFGANGVATINAGGNDYSNERAALIQLPDGKLLIGVGGTDSNGLTESAVLVRLTTSGAADTTFGTNGTRVLSLTRGSSALHGFALDASGKLIAVGRAWTDSGDSDFAVLRFVL